MAIGLSSGLRNTRMDLIKTALDAGSGAGTIKIYSGTQPATGAALSGNTLLATITLADPSAASASGGVLTLTTPAATTVSTSGTATWARFEDSTGAFVMDADVGAVGSSATLKLHSTTLLSGQPVYLLPATITDGPVDAAIDVQFTNAPSGLSVSGGGKVVTATSSNSTRNIKGDYARSTGKRYFEIKLTTYATASGFSHYAGLALATGLANTLRMENPGFFTYKEDGTRSNSPVGNSIAFGTAWAATNTIGIAVDFDAGKIWFARNNTWQASGNPATGANPAFTFVPNTALVPAINVGANTHVFTGVFGGNDETTALTYTPPSGFFGWANVYGG